MKHKHFDKIVIIWVVFVLCFAWCVGSLYAEETYGSKTGETFAITACVMLFVHAVITKDKLLAVCSTLGFVAVTK
jgi:hypothetical protein